MRVYLEKAGFIRDAEQDFSDDGSKFYCYKGGLHGRVRVSKCTGYGNYYIDGDLSGNLEYNEYSVLPHYKAVGVLNGISQDVITQEMVVKLYQDCIEYEKEYEEAEAKIVWPTKEELKDIYEQIIAKRLAEFNTVKDITTADILLSMGDYELKNFKYYYTRLKGNAFPKEDVYAWTDRIYKTPTSRWYQRNLDSELEDNWYYKECLEYIEKYK